MEAVELDPNGYGGTYKLIGGRPALDLINTISWPGTEREHEWLSSTNNADLWGEAVGIGLKQLDEGDLEELRRVRGIISDVIKPIAHNDRPDSSELQVFNETLTEVMTSRRIDPDTLRFTWIDSDSLLIRLAPIVLDAADLITSLPNNRLKTCPACDWVFEDHTRNGRRRWCDMADCGSRAKARNYYHRHKDQS